MPDEVLYDRRMIERDGETPGYVEYINSLRCCMCGSPASCDCSPTISVISKPKQKQKQDIKINSVCTPHIDWIDSQIELGISGAVIHRGLMQRFGFKNSLTSVTDFVRKLKGIKYNS